jgi:hypothetical protein
MNGRIYDGLLGRFLSADLTVSNPGNLQSFNRYSYVRNNPLSLTDPSGFTESDEEKKQREEAERQAREAREKAARDAAWNAGGFMGLLYHISGGSLGTAYSPSAAATNVADQAANQADNNKTATQRVESEQPQAVSGDTVSPDPVAGQKEGQKAPVDSPPKLTLGQQFRRMYQQIINARTIKGGVSFGATAGGAGFPGLPLCGPAAHVELNIGLTIDRENLKNSRIEVTGSGAGMFAAGYALFAGAGGYLAPGKDAPEEGFQVGPTCMHIEGAFGGPPVTETAVVSATVDIPVDGPPSATFPLPERLGGRWSGGSAIFFGAGVSKSVTWTSPSMFPETEEP